MDILIAGLGISPSEHLTAETERCLRQCREVLYLDTGPVTKALLERLVPVATPLYAQAYVPGRPRLSGYHLMAARVVEAALDRGPVAFAVQGHPLVYVHAPVLIRRMAQALGLEVRLLPAISSLDTLFAELWLDPASEGLQVYEATDLLLRRRPLQPDVPALIWQVGNLETRLHTTRRSRPERLRRFVDHLAQWYPLDHKVTVYFSSPHPLVQTLAEVVALGELASIAGALHPGVTLYLPPVQRRPVVDVALLAQLDDPAHLERITQG
ncbi:MAG: hypothetical protein JXX28_03755 [Deltaproteobacteria bacterium]|nr:hypothetical protein [Deltaproteobacteria bacterium]